MRVCNEMSHYEMANWVGTGEIGFKDIRPFFNGYNDVQSAVVKAIYNPPQPIESSRIDLRKLEKLGDSKRKISTRIALQTTNVRSILP